MSRVDCFQAIVGLTTVALRLFGLAWKLFLLPISIISCSLGLVTRSIGLSFWVASCVLSYWLTMIGLTNSGRNRKPLSTPPAVSASVDFLSEFGEKHPNFVPGGFLDAVDGFSLLRQFEGPSSPKDMVTELQTVLGENAPALVDASIDTENEHTNNPPLMEEPDTQNGAALEADQANECDMKEVEKGIETEAKLYEEEDLQFAFEPEQEPDVIQVLVRLPIGERIGKSFPCTATLQSVYDLVDSSGCLDVGSYTLVNFFPRVLYGQDQLSSTLQELGLHPQTSLFVELNS